MKEDSDYAERRQHERTYLQNLVVGVLNSEEPLIIGTIPDISHGGVRCTYNALKLAPNESPFHSIDLIADGQYLNDIPCECVWDVKVETDSHSKLTELRQCGIVFGELTPNQAFLVKSFVNRCASMGTGTALDVQAHYS